MVRVDQRANVLAAMTVATAGAMAEVIDVLMVRAVVDHAKMPARDEGVDRAATARVAVARVETETGIGGVDATDVVAAISVTIANRKRRPLKVSR